MHEPLPLRRQPIAVRPCSMFCTATTRRVAELVLKLVGPPKYAADPSTEIASVAYAVDDGPVQLWLPGDPVPPEFIEAANNPTWVVAAHNDSFETAVEQHILGPRYGFPLIPLERHRCTHGDGARCWDCRRGWIGSRMRSSWKIARTKLANV